MGHSTVTLKANGSSMNLPAHPIDARIDHFNTAVQICQHTDHSAS